MENSEINAINSLITYLERDNELKQIRDIVPVKDWLMSEYYLGTEVSQLWSFWKDAIVEFFENNCNILIATGCFTGDTKISLLDGTEKTLKELTEEYKDKKFWVYSINELHEIVPGLAYNPRLTGKKIPVYELELDNGEKIKVTENHKFMLRNGVYKEVKNLKIGDSLMPLYRKYNDRGYEEVYNPSKNKYQNTHTIINEYCHKKPRGKINKFGSRDHYVTHHRNYIKQNNTPQNLFWMFSQEHYKYHASNCIHLTNGFLKMVKNKGERYYKWTNNIAKGFKNSKIALKKAQENGRKQCLKRNSNINFIKKVQEANQKFYKKRFFKNVNISNIDELLLILNNSITLSDVCKKIGSGYKPIFAQLRRHGYDIKSVEDLKNQKILNISGLKYNYTERNKKRKETFKSKKLLTLNHKIKSLKFYGYEDVYDIEVEKYHNFALSSGVFVHNSLGGGKSYAGIYIFLRLLYYLSCFNFPSLRFGLTKSSSIVFMYLSPTMSSAEMTGFGKLRKIIDQSPYFIEEFKRDKNKNSILNFNDKVQIFSGSDKGHFIGSDLFAILFDEANFVRSGGGELGKLEKAISIYRESINRRKSRFIYQGQEFGASIIASSVDTITSFTEQEIERNRNNPHALIKHVTKYSLYPDDFSKKKFWVFKGDKNTDAFVVNEDNRIKYKSLLNYLTIEEEIKENLLSFDTYLDVSVPDAFVSLFEHVPNDFYSSFALDVTGSLKEVCGISIQTHEKFFSEASKFNQCIDMDRMHPFLRDYIVVSTNTPDNELINSLKEDFRGIPGHNYYLRIDLSKSSDSTGIAMGHYDRNIKKGVLDFMLRIDPPNYPEKIDYNKIIEFVMYLKQKRNFNIKHISMDQYQSEFFLQYFQKKGITTLLLSVDRTDEQYLFLKSKIIGDQLVYYFYDQFKFELFNLIRDNERKKVDHPPNQGKRPKDGGYGKDVCDAVAGLIYIMFISEAVTEIELKNTLEILRDRNRAVSTSRAMDVIKMEEKLLNCKLKRVK